MDAAETLTECAPPPEALAGQRQILHLLASGGTLEQVLDAFCQHLETILDDALCSVLLLDEAGTRLRHGAAPTLPAAYSSPIDGIEIGPMVGSCGTAAFRGKPVVVEDVATDPLWTDFRPLALAHGLRACWSVPIIDTVGAGVLGTFAAYHRLPRRPREADLVEVVEASRLAAVTIRSKRTEEALRRSEARFRALVQHASDGITVLDAHGAVRYQSPAVARMLGYEPQEAIEPDPFALIEEQDARLARCLLADLKAEPDGSRPADLRLRHRDGSWRSIEATFTNLLADPSVRGILVNTRDVTERKRSEEALRANEARFSSLVRNEPDLISIWAADGAIRYESPAIERTLGYAAEELIGRHVLTLVHPDDVERVGGLFAEAFAKPGDNLSGTFRAHHKDGSWRWLEATGTNLLADPSVGGIVVNSRDVTERARAEERLAHLAYHDPLTGLPNRTLFMERLEEAFSRSRRSGDVVAVLFLDLDGFKLINDSRGHHVGDNLLGEVGRRLRGALPAAATLARLGGDEFAVLLDAVVDEAEASRLAEGLLGALRPPVRLDGGETYVGASVGVALGTRHRARPADLLRSADIALYQAKRRDAEPTPCLSRECGCRWCCGGSRRRPFAARWSAESSCSITSRWSS